MGRVLPYGKIVTILVYASRIGLIRSGELWQQRPCWPFGGRRYVLFTACAVVFRAFGMIVDPADQLIVVVRASGHGKVVECFPGGFESIPGS
jgi:hypothetical protein